MKLSRGGAETLRVKAEIPLLDEVIVLRASACLRAILFLGSMERHLV